MEADKNKTYESYAALCFNFVSFSWPILPKKKKWENGNFWTKIMG